MSANELAVHEPGFYWVRLGENRPEVAYFHGGFWWLSGTDKPWETAGVSPLSDRLEFGRPCHGGEQAGVDAVTFRNGPSRRADRAEAPAGDEVV